MFPNTELRRYKLRLSKNWDLAFDFRPDHWGLGLVQLNARKWYAFIVMFGPLELNYCKSRDRITLYEEWKETTPGWFRFGSTSWEFGTEEGEITFNVTEGPAVDIPMSVICKVLEEWVKQKSC